MTVILLKKFITVHLNANWLIEYLLSSIYVVSDKSNLNYCNTFCNCDIMSWQHLFQIFRTKYETQEKQLTNKVSTLEKEKLALKSQLSDIINELTQVFSLHIEIFSVSDGSNLARGNLMLIVITNFISLEMFFPNSWVSSLFLWINIE